MVIENGRWCGNIIQKFGSPVMQDPLCTPPSEPYHVSKCHTQALNPNSSYETVSPDRPYKWETFHNNKPLKSISIFAWYYFSKGLTAKGFEYQRFFLHSKCLYRKNFVFQRFRAPKSVDSQRRFTIFCPLVFKTFFKPK